MPKFGEHPLKMILQWPAIFAQIIPLNGSRHFLPHHRCRLEAQRQGRRIAAMDRPADFEGDDENELESDFTERAGLAPAYRRAANACVDPRSEERRVGKEGRSRW